MCNLYSSKDLKSFENNSTYSHYWQKSWQKKPKYTQLKTAIHRLTMQSHMSMFFLLNRTIQICVSCFRVVKIWLFEYNLLILTTGCSTWHLVGKELFEDLRIRIVAFHKDGLGYK